MKKTLVWFRQDLRLADNPALYQALEQGSVFPIYIWDAQQTDQMGSASRWWLYHSLSKLNHALNHHLNVYQGSAKAIILKLIQTQAIDAVYWNRCYEPARIQEDSEIKACLRAMPIECRSFHASVLFEPWDILKQDGTPYKVFTPFYQNGCLKAPIPRQALPKHRRSDFIKDSLNTHTLEDLKLLAKHRWYQSLESHWTVGEEAAQARFEAFLAQGLSGYKEGRDFPAHASVSRLSPHLHFGEISPHSLWQGVQRTSMHHPISTKDSEHFLRELAWREFSYYLLYHFPSLPSKNFQAKFDRFPWHKDPDRLKVWQRGQTGYPIVDAGMRELWQTGYMHNRVRMIVGSFLVKNLQLHWHEGAAWFWDCLVDADLANNSASWQWVAGSGADAAPYFRIFNPVTQGEKFDPEGIYTKRFVPELANMPIQYLFEPWQAPPALLDKAGVVLGKTYPHPVVDLKVSRQEALEAFASLKTIGGF